MGATQSGAPLEKGLKMNETVMVEIRAAEGGADAKDLVYEQAGLYARFCKREGL